MVSHGHAGLGSGHQFSVMHDNSKVETDTTRGQLYVRLGWATAEDGSILSPPDDQWSVAKKDIKVSTKQSHGVEIINWESHKVGRNNLIGAGILFDISNYFFFLL